ncbi:MAG TPA: sodium:solute symporter family protein [Candidatus Hydrogenedentes bacterium]|nr:sodium:solute symporter family protein [Candidatus Hydrogenedentota bacterium]HOL76588.1 sodium:solute symporter family protein [Candidatus Hydrogenedentota bacterium]HPO84421.1 sodium:solute symporter family protein [Candidatus Hydrogenedentota bacterium]
MDLLTIVIIIGYLLITAYLGYRGYTQTKTATDYLIAGRKAHPAVMALSYGAAFISTSAIVGFGGVAANFGMGLLWLTFLNIFVGVFIAFVFFGGRTRRMGHLLDAHTFPEFLGRRFQSRFLHVFSALVIFVFMPLYAMAVIKGGAEFIAAVFHVSPEIALYIFALIVAAYVIPGGLKGVMLTDALQGIIMLIGMTILIFSTYFMLGGVIDAHQSLTALKSEVPQSLAAIGHRGWTSMPLFGWASTKMPPAGSPIPPDPHNLWWIMVTTIILGVGIGVLAQPQLIVRFMTVKSQQSLNRAVGVGGAFILMMTGVAFTVGALSNVYFHDKEVITCRILDDSVLMDPGPGGKQKLKPISADASDDVKARAKRFITYRLLNEPSTAPPHYVLFTPKTQIERGSANAPDVIRPGLISIARTISNETTMQGNVDRIIPTYVNSAMPRWFGVIFMLTLLAAAMSTLAGQFHTIGTAIGRDVLQQVTSAKPERSVLVTRIGIGIGLIVAIVLGRILGDNIIALATAIFFGLCAASFLPAFIGGLFSKRITKAAAISSVVAGFFTSLFWLLFVNAKTAVGIGLCSKLFHKAVLVPEGWSVTWTVVDPLVIGLPISVIVAAIVTFFTKPMDESHISKCFGK